MQNRLKNGNFILILCLAIFMISSGCNQLNMTDTSTSQSKSTSMDATQTLGSVEGKVIVLATFDRLVDEENQVYFLKDDFSVESSFKNQYNSSLALSSNSCELIYLFGGSSQIEITKLSLDGKVLEKKVNFFANESSKYLYLFSISPDEKWVAFKEASGEWGQSASDAPFQDVAIVSINSNSMPTVKILTENGAAFVDKLTWSPDSRYLSFSDNDANGVNQIYIFDTLTGGKKQVSRFTSQIIVHEINWSPDSKLMAATIFNKEKTETGYMTFTGRVVLLSAGDGTVWTANLGKGEYDNISFYWGKENRLLFFTYSQNLEKSILFWYNANTKMVEKEVVLSKSLSSWSNFAFPLSEDLSSVAVFGGNAYIYNSENEDYSLINTQIIEKIIHNGSYQLIKTSSGSLFSPICN